MPTPKIAFIDTKLNKVIWHNPMTRFPEYPRYQIVPNYTANSSKH